MSAEVAANAAGAARRELLLSRLGLALALVCASALILWLERGLTFVADELVYVGLMSGPFHIPFEPYLGSLNLFPLLAFKGVLHLFGTSYFAFGLLEVSGLVLCVGALFEYARRRTRPGVALAGSIVILFFGSGWVVLLEPLVSILWLFSLGFGICMLLALERHSLPGDLLACALLCLSIATFSTGLAFAAAGAVAIWIRPGWRRRAYVVAVPVMLYAAWRLSGPYGADQAGAQLANLPRLPAYFVDSLGGVATALVGSTSVLGDGPATGLFIHGISLGRAVLAAALVIVELVAIVILVRWIRPRIRPALWPPVVLLAAAWILQGMVLGPGRTPTQSRYLFGGAVLVMLVLAELARGVNLSRRSYLAVFAAAAVAVAANVPHFVSARARLAGYSARARADLTVLTKLGDDRIDPYFLTSGKPGAPYLLFAYAFQVQSLEQNYGLPDLSVAELRSQPEPIRKGVDRLLVSALMVNLAPGKGGTGCRSLSGAPGRRIEFVLPPDGVELRAADASPVRLRRFADRYFASAGVLPAHRFRLLAIPRGHSRVPWRAQLAASRATLCPAGR